MSAASRVCRTTPLLSGKDEARFWLNVGKPAEPEECWLWTGAVGGRYHNQGNFCVAKEVHGAARLSWVLAFGAIPDDLYVLHNCPGGDNPRCVNPKHLWLGTQRDNIRDCSAKGRMATGDRNCAHTHPEKVSRGEKNGNAVLTVLDVIAIRAEYATGKCLQREIAARRGIARRTVSAIVSGQLWASVPFGLPANSEPKK